MTYKLNGVELDPQPTTGRWVARELIGYTGDGRPIYAPTRQFEMDFQLLSPTGMSVLQNNYLAIDATGTIVLDLPRYGYSDYTFYSYTGCYIQEPVAGTYFTQNHQNVKLLVTNIVTVK